MMREITDNSMFVQFALDNCFALQVPKRPATNSLFQKMTDLILSGNAMIAIIQAVAFCFEMLHVVSESLGRITHTSARLRNLP